MIDRQSPTDQYVRGFVSRRCIRELLCALAAFLLPTGTAVSAAELKGAEGLISLDIEPTLDGVRDYLSSIHPTPETQKLAEQMIVQLGDDDFFQREQATRTLLRSPQFPKKQLQKAADGTDPEVRWRARQILRLGENHAEQTLFQVFNFIRTNKLKGLTREVYAALPIPEREYVKQEGIRAVVATVTMTDGDWLLGQREVGSTAQRLATVRGIDQVCGDKALEYLQPVLKQDDEEVLLATARLTLNRGYRPALSTFSRLLNSESLRIRTRAIHSLRQATGIDLDFVAYDKSEKREAASTRWQAWVSANGATFDLKLPLDDRKVLLGRTLICFYSQKKIVEVDGSGKVIFEQGNVNGVWGCDGTPEGHRVVCSYSDKKIIEYDNSGKVIWEVNSTPGRPFSVERVDDGNTLISCYDTGSIVLYGPDKKIVWQHKMGGQPMDASHLPNGNILVALYQGNKVIEIDRKTKKTIWEISVSRPRVAQRLENANTLVVQPSSGRVAEFDTTGKEVWSHKGLSNPNDAQRLENGNTLISNSKGVVEIDRNGKTVWQKLQNSPSRVCRY